MNDSEKLKYLLSECKQWLHTTEKRVRLLDSRGEARLIAPDDRLRTVIKEVDSA